MAIDSPCYKCEERHIGCHSECEKYAAFKAELETEKKSQAVGDGFLDYSRRKYDLLKKRKGKS